MKIGSDPAQDGSLAPEWQEVWATFTSSAWRLETLPVYRVAAEADEFERFIKTGEVNDEEESDDWLDQLRRWRSEG